MSLSSFSTSLVAPDTSTATPGLPLPLDPCTGFVSLPPFISCSVSEPPVAPSFTPSSPCSRSCFRRSRTSFSLALAASSSRSSSSFLSRAFSSCLASSLICVRRRSYSTCACHSPRSEFSSFTKSRSNLSDSWTTGYGWSKSVSSGAVGERSSGKSCRKKSESDFGESFGTVRSSPARAAASVPLSMCLLASAVSASASSSANRCRQARGGAITSFARGKSAA
mmetsp:Transcript_16109/g.48539  ORF Transcript_16109/g.48539 Transcript_16109/m.48539 type:complete len:223 (+) Transcript_16109:473-1141(+)